MDLKHAISAALAAGAFVAMPVIALDSASEQAFYRLDSSKDGNIDQSEAQAWPWLQQNFSKYDHDRDSKLGKDEFAEAISAARAARQDTFGAAGATNVAGRTFESLDRNNDGNIDTTEAAAWPQLQQSFSQYDHDRDSKLGKDEFAEAVSKLGAASPTSSGAAGASSMQFDSLDKNNDGKLDPSEVQALPSLQQNFSQYDTNKDGTLGKDEFRAAVNAGAAR